MAGEKVGVNYESLREPSGKDLALCVRLLKEGGIEVRPDVKAAKIDMSMPPTYDDFALMYPDQTGEDLQKAWSFFTDEKLQYLTGTKDRKEEGKRWDKVINEIKDIESENLRKLTRDAFDTRVLIPWTQSKYPDDTKYIALQDGDLNYVVQIEAPDVVGDLKLMPISLVEASNSATIPTEITNRHTHGGARLSFDSREGNDFAPLRFRMARAMGLVEKAWHSIPTKERKALRVHERAIGFAERTIGGVGRGLDQMMFRFNRGQDYEKQTGAGESYAFVWQLPGNTTTLENMPIQT